MILEKTLRCGVFNSPTVPRITTERCTTEMRSKSLKIHLKHSVLSSHSTVDLQYLLKSELLRMFSTVLAQLQSTHFLEHLAVIDSALFSISQEVLNYDLSCLL